MTLSSILAPLLGSVIINLNQTYGSTALGYRLIFAAAALSLIVAAVCVLFVREKPRQTREFQPRPAPPRRNVGMGWKLAFQTRAGKARGFLLFWPLWEWFTRSIGHIRRIPHAANDLLEVRFTKHRGRPIDLPDGTSIHKGDPVIELHFHNQSFLEITERLEPWKYMRIIAQNLHALAEWMLQSDFPGEARAIYGVTLLYRGAPRLGFTLFPRPKGLHAWLERFFMNGLLVLYNSGGEKRLLQGTTYGTYPQEVWMSREQLLKRFGSSSHSDEA